MVDSNDTINEYNISNSLTNNQSIGNITSPYLIINGGDNLFLNEKNETSIAVVEIGKGKVVVLVDSYTFSNEILGGTFTEPDESLRSIYNTEYYVFKEFLLKDVNWINLVNFKKGIFKTKLRIRYQGELLAAEIRKSNKGDNLLVSLKESERGIASGQSVVFYNKDEVLGGGIIDLTCCAQRTGGRYQTDQPLAVMIYHLFYAFTNSQKDTGQVDINHHLKLFQ